jgi:hypothetical protein
MEYGNVKFADVQVGSIVKVGVKVGNYYDQTAVGTVVEKTEKLKEKVVLVQFGFAEENIVNVLVEETEPDGGQPMYELLEIVRSYV